MPLHVVCISNTSFALSNHKSPRRPIRSQRGSSISPTPTPECRNASYALLMHYLQCMHAGFRCFVIAFFVGLSLSLCINICIAICRRFSKILMYSALGIRDQDAVVCRLKHVRQVEFHVFVDQEGDAGRWDDSDEVRSESVRQLLVHHIESSSDSRLLHNTHPL
jgi:hypothetical protein